MTTFLFDDFFSGKNTIDHLVPFRGQLLPVRMRAVLSLRDREAARAKALKVKMDANGNVDLSGYDQSAFTIEVLASMIVAWPFTFSDGNPVPVNRDTIGALDSTLVDALSVVAMTHVAGPSAEEEHAFETASPAPSVASAEPEAND